MVGLFALCWASVTAAAPNCRVDPERKKLFRLELTVPATWCGRTRQDPSCREFPKASAAQLHGLWPNYESGYPSGYCPHGECQDQAAQYGRFCRYPAPPGLYQADWWPTLKPYMAGTESCLERHEWVKHGTCSEMDAANYFRWSLETTRRIGAALAEARQDPMTRGEFDTLIRTRLPDLNGAVRLNCRGRAVASLYLLYEWGNPPSRAIPTRDPGNHFGNCPNAFSIPREPRR